MNEKLKEKIKESLSSVLPITVIVLLLSVTLVPMEIGTLALFLTGAVLLIVGMGFFQLGAEMTMTPLGQSVGSHVIKSNKIWFILAVSFVMGVFITIAEPDLQVLANQVASIPNQVLVWTVAVGVGLFLVVAVLRILFHVSLSNMLLIFYILLFVLSFFSPDSFTSVAFDSGGSDDGADDGSVYYGARRRFLRVEERSRRGERQLRSCGALQHRTCYDGSSFGYFL